MYTYDSRSLRIACERCDNALSCKKLNPYNCDNSFVPALDTNFNMEKEYEVDLTAEK